MANHKGFLLLIFTTLTNIFFVIFFLKNVNTPIFISGNLKILYLNLTLAIFLIIIKYFFKDKKNKIYKIFRFSFYELFSSIFIPLVTTFLFWSLGPTIIDRSLSVNVLGTLYLSERPLDLNDLNWSLYTNYMNGEFQTKKRIKEQLLIGNIIQDLNGRYLLTKKGLRAAKLNIFISNYFGLSKSSAMPKNLPKPIK